MIGPRVAWWFVLAASSPPSKLEQILFLLLLFGAPALIGSIPAAIVGIVANIKQNRGCLGWLWIPTAILLGVISGGLAALAAAWMIGDLGIGGAYVLIAASLVVGGLVSLVLIVTPIIYHFVASRRGSGA
jgi:hypothetical protein